MYVHGDRRAMLRENLLEEHPRDLARLDIGVRHEVPLWPVRTRPAES